MAFSAESGGGRAIKCRGRVETFGRFAAVGEVPGRASPVFRMARSGSPVRRVFAESEECDQCLRQGSGTPLTSGCCSGLGGFGARG